jgi:hypothetical protein
MAWVFREWYLARGLESDMSREYCPICATPLPNNLNDPTGPQACEHAEGEWWERADWRCPSCDYRLHIDGMYDCGGSCPRCFEEMKLDYIRMDIPF